MVEVLYLCLHCLVWCVLSYTMYLLFSRQPILSRTCSMMIQMLLLKKEWRILISISWWSLLYQEFEWLKMTLSVNAHPIKFSSKLNMKLLYSSLYYSKSFALIKILLHAVFAGWWYKYLYIYIIYIITYR